MRVPKITKKQLDLMTQAAAEDSIPSHLQLAWWKRYTRWTQTSLEEAQHAEKVLLQLSRSIVEVKEVQVGQGKQQTMHTIIAGDESNPPLVCLPGYGAGAAFYFRNLDDLSKQFRVYLVDLLGTGLSGRPKWTAKSREEAENFFLEALKSWKKEVGIDKMLLVGHSLGGYIGATYALKYPEDVEHLVLCCPAGMSVPDPSHPALSPPEFWSWRGQLVRLGKTFWNNGGTPGGIIRGMGPFGPRLVNGYARNRFREGVGLSDEETLAFGSYFYHITAQRGSGEYALHHILGPWAFARHPLKGRLHELKVPCSLIYGESDWMKPANGKKVFFEMEEERGKLDAADLQFDVIPHAGHYPFLDQPEMFLQKMLKQMHSYLTKRGSSSARTAEQFLQQANNAANRAMNQVEATASARKFDL